jgi:hypothetical protein
MTPPDRQTNSRLAEVTAECQRCAWTSNARNAHGNAARHHDATGHAVRVDTVRVTIYGNPDAPIEGQQELAVDETTFDLDSRLAAASRNAP